MGADYIPEDNLLGRVNKERTRKLLTDCKEANYNTVRIWGGGYYPDDFFTISVMNWDCLSGRISCLRALPMNLTRRLTKISGKKYGRMYAGCVTMPASDSGAATTKWKPRRWINAGSLPKTEMRLYQDF